MTAVKRPHISVRVKAGLVDSKFWFEQKVMDTKAGLIERAPSYEIDWPFRVCTSWVIHLPLTTKGVILGRWKTNPNFGPLEGAWVDEHLEQAIKSTYGTAKFQAEHFVNDDSDVIPPTQD